MNFLNPWALGIGGAAVVLPVLIHWLTKPRPRKMSLSTIRFVRQIVQQKRARYRLRDWLVLLMRAAAVVLAAWAFARPLTGAKPLIAAGEAGDAVRVVLLDSSQSMTAVTGGTSAFERGRTVAASYLKFQTGLRASLILAGAKPAAVFDQSSTNLSALRDALATAKARPQRLEVQAAIDQAAKNLAGAAPGQRLELIVISDFQRSNWSTADFSVLPKDTKIQFESAAPSQTPGNVAVLRAGVSGRLQQGREARLEVEIGNYSKQPRQVQVDVTLGDRPYTVAGLCPPQVKTTLTTAVPLPAAGWMVGRVTIVDAHDALPADDSRSFVLGVRAAPVYALVTREPSRPHPSSSHFVERALVPNPRRDASGGVIAGSERVIRLDPAKLDQESLATAAMLVIDHPGKLPAESINALANLMRRGRGVLYIAAEPADASNLKLLADAAGGDLKMPVEFVPPPGNADRHDLFLVDWKKDQAPFVNLGESAGALLSPLRFGGGLETRQLTGGLVDDVVATYSDRSAAIVVTPCGAGTLAVLNADLSRSSLASSAAFVPMIGELAGRLLASRGSAEAVACGDLLNLALPPEVGAAQGLSIAAMGSSDSQEAAPASAGDFGALADSGGAVMWRWDSAGAPGVYVVKRNAATVFAVATAGPAVESDLEPLDPAVLQTRLAGTHEVYFQTAGTAPPKDDKWAWVLSACAVCMIGEVALLKGFKT